MRIRIDLIGNAFISATMENYKKIEDFIKAVYKTPENGFINFGGNYFIAKRFIIAIHEEVDKEQNEKQKQN